MVIQALISILAVAPSPQVSAAQGVLHRTIGSRASAFKLELMPTRADGLDAFEVTAKDGTVQIKGTSSVALTRGAYEYLKDACHCMVTWEGKNMQLPAKLPDYTTRSVVGPNKYRHYYNICTFGYTLAWWDWKHWEREIDWMALHGINMPLAMTGQEKVWQKVFRDLGLPDESITKFFSGPAFLPWHWMGNLNSHGGPMPQSWIDGQADLQKKILARERSLGMTPVTPGFSGFVPVDFAKYHPDVKLFSPTAWGGFEPTTFVDTRSPMFQKIGKAFVEEYRKEFGSDHLYLCDTFNEQNPQFPKETELEDLHSCGKAVYDALKAGDPDAVWVMQGWLFYNEANYWTQPRVNSLLGGVPDGRMIILDLATNEHAVWKAYPAVKAKGWIFNTLHNYGQNTVLNGDFQVVADRAIEDVSNPDHGNMLGMGLTMEGIDNNPAVFELATDAMWTTKPIDTLQWVRDYSTARYGVADAHTIKAWETLHEALKTRSLVWSKCAWRARPSFEQIKEPLYEVRLMRAALDELIAAGPKLKNNPLYQRDLVDLTKAWLGCLADVQLAGVLANWEDNRPAAKQFASEFFTVLDTLDKVMACRPEHRLSTWISDARKWGKNPAEKDLMEWNARMQVTIWGGPYLYDYANKEWAGLNGDFLAQRWHYFLDESEKHPGVIPDMAKWEEAWTRKTGRIRESAPGEAVKVCAEAIAKSDKLPTKLEAVVDLNQDAGIAVGKPVRDSGHIEGNAVAARAFDGNILGDYWAANPAPQWIEVDLEAERSLTGVHLFPYYGDGRSYQYKVEVSSDDKTWNLVADGSKNEKPASLRGYRHDFAAVSARYVRVTMLSNSANTAVHLREVRVFGK